MNELQERKNIEQALKGFQNGALVINAQNLLNTLGYESELTVDFESSLAEDFISYFDQFGKLNRERALVDEWESIDFLFQLTEEEISGTGETRIAFKNRQFDDTIMESYVFFAVKLKGSHYTRTQLSTITREINKPMPMPAMILFQHGETVSLAVIDRRLHKRDKAKDVLEKVTLIKDIDSDDPHPAHIQILFDLSRNELFRVHGFSNFVELHRAWAKTLDIQELNKRFYRELSNWYFWAMDSVTFPEDAGEDIEVRNAASVIRLITRLIFVWFIKEKKLVPDIFFNPRKIEKILVSTDPQKSTYYKAILQNLFFATLNQEMNTPEKPNNRKFRGKGRQHYNITSLYRYEAYFANPNETLKQFEKIPFLNGGLFECLDKKDDASDKILRVDGFSDRADNQLSVPNFLFFSEEKDVDLNNVYDTKGRRYKVRGLIDILRRYKFTITENTPIEEEVALDPELLGKVFENLLAAYNPETGATARKQTGSFYTRREIVNYMVDESLIAHLKNALNASGFPLDKGGQGVTTRLRHLLAYNDEPHQFTDAETEQLINAIDTLKILDPACGSGAFPMGTLHKLVFILGKLDPRNDQWRQRQIDKVEMLIERADEIDDSTVRRNTVRDLEREIDNINEAFTRNELDYGRKLYLIENCIYGVDIQPIAVQIAKLRFFISLVVDQRIDDAQENRGVRPLPNLETKFVAGNTLIGVEKPTQLLMRNPEIDRKERELGGVRRKHFTARTPRTKEKYRSLDKQIRAEISQLLKSDGFPSETTEKIANWDPYNQNGVADFFDAEWMFGITEGFDVVIGNPPYVRQEKIKALKPAFKKHYACYTGAADLYVYFYERGLQLLRQNGIHTFICSNSWLDVNYGAPLQKYVLDNTAGAVICHSEAEREFESADINTIVSILRNGIPDADSRARFFTFKTFIGDPNVENRRERTRTYTELAQTGTRDNRYAGDKWGGKYLRAPDIYWTILEKGKDKLVRLGDIAEVRRGFTTGANEFFYLDDERIQAWDLADAFLKPVIKSPRECKSIRVDPSQLQFKLFMCHADKAALSGTAALEYIEWGESQGYHQRPSCRGRTRWYDLGQWSYPDMLWSDAYNVRFGCFENAGDYLGDKRFFVIEFKEENLTTRAYLNSTVIPLLIETEGIANLGEGVIYTNVYWLKTLPILKESHIPGEIHQCYENIKTREILPIFDEIDQTDRCELDAIIFDALGLTQGERDGVYEAVVNLVESRLRKARSLRAK